MVDSLPLMNVKRSPIEVFRMRDLGILADLIVHSVGNTPWTDLSKINSDGRTIHFIIIHIIHQKIDDETKIRKKKTILKSMKKCSLWLILPIFLGHPVFCATKENMKKMHPIGSNGAEGSAHQIT